VTEPTPPPAPAPEQTEPSNAEKRIAELEAQVKEKENKYLYLYAEMENLKKRVAKERSDLLRYGWEPVARDLLQTVDNLERALAHVPPGSDAAFVNGLNLILNEFKTTLNRQGIQHVETHQRAFDPNFHEAVGQEPSDQPEGTIVKEHVRGYTLHGRLLRPARVVVSGGKNNP
jgi:molecular chaperone GrpE